jgi:N-acetylglucosaminylphosphatidylinositol deacetylase
MSFTDFENILEMQGWAKSILLILIITNFIIIFGLKFQINIITKIKSMFDIKEIKKDISSTKTVLLIIAHPEDELSYWSPTIRTLINYNIKLKILCLSLKNNKRCQKIFKDEENSKNFKEISKILKLEDNKLNTISSYEPDVISNEIKKFLDDNNDIGTILSFDENGAGNAEHANCYEGLELFLKNNREEIKKKEIKIFLLDSFNIFFKYTFIIPFIFFFFKEFGFIINHCFDYNKWMKIHHNNLNIGFLKKIAIFLNCYSYFNSFTKVELK